MFLHKLEGDGPPVFGCFDVLQSLSVGVRTAYYPNLSAASARVAQGSSCIAEGTNWSP